MLNVAETYPSWNCSGCGCPYMLLDGIIVVLCRRFDLCSVLDGQPLQHMMRERGRRDRPLFAFEMWHEKLLQGAPQAS